MLFLLPIKKRRTGAETRMAHSFSLSLSHSYAGNEGRYGRLVESSREVLPPLPASCLIRRATCCCAVSMEVSRSDKRSLEYRTTGCISGYFAYRCSKSWPSHTPAFVTPQNPSALGFINMIFRYKNLSCKIKKNPKHGDVAT